MKECPSCGKMNFSNVSNCTECSQPFPETSELPEYRQSKPIRKPKEGMHWIFAFLIMITIRMVFQWFLFKDGSGAPSHGNNGFLMVLELLVSYFALWVWFALTSERYFRSGFWVFYMYVWLLVNPLITFGSYSYQSVIYGHGTGIVRILILLYLYLSALFLFIKYRRQNFCRFAEESSQSLPESMTTVSPAKQGMHWAYALLILLGINYGGEYLIIVMMRYLAGNAPYEGYWFITQYYFYIKLFFNMIMSGIALWIWIKITTRRYFHTRSWHVFTYSWIVFSWIASLASIYTIIMALKLGLEFMYILYTVFNSFLYGIPFILAGTIGFTIHRNHKKAREAYHGDTGQ